MSFHLFPYLRTSRSALLVSLQDSPLYPAMVCQASISMDLPTFFYPQHRGPTVLLPGRRFFCLFGCQAVFFPAPVPHDGDAFFFSPLPVSLTIAALPPLQPTCFSPFPQNLYSFFRPPKMAALHCTFFPSSASFQDFGLLVVQLQSFFRFQRLFSLLLIFDGICRGPLLQLARHVDFAIPRRPTYLSRPSFSPSSIFRSAVSLKLPWHF